MSQTTKGHWTFYCHFSRFNYQELPDRIMAEPRNSFKEWICSVFCSTLVETWLKLDPRTGQS